MTPITKAVILARGLGTRLRAEVQNDTLTPDQKKIANAGIKALMPIIDGKTLLDLSIEKLLSAGFSEICLVIGEEHFAIREHCAKKNLNVSFAIQKDPLGTADAVFAAKNFAENENFLTVNSDNIYPESALRELRGLGGAGLIAFSRDGLIKNSNIAAEKIAKFATLKIDENSLLQEITEKPATVDPNAHISMNAWVFSPTIFTACERIERSPRGEFELADAVNFAIQELGENFMCINSDEGVLDLSNRADVAELAAMLK